MVDAFGSGLAFRNFIGDAGNFAARVMPAAINPGMAAGTLIGNAISPAVHDFGVGALGLARPSVTIPYASIPVRAAPAAVAPKAAPAAAKLGQLSPAAAAVMANATGAAPAKAPAAAAGMDPATAAALGKLSFRQLLTLGEVADKTSPKGIAPRPPTSSDTAGGMLTSIYQSQFQNALTAAGKDPAKQQAAIDAFEKKVLPIALKGNTADEYIYGQPGTQ